MRRSYDENVETEEVGLLTGKASAAWLECPPIVEICWSFLPLLESMQRVMLWANTAVLEMMMMGGESVPYVPYLSCGVGWDGNNRRMRSFRKWKASY